MPSKLKNDDENVFKNKLIPIRGKGLCYLDSYGLETVGLNFTLKPVATVCKKLRDNIQKGVLYMFKFHGMVNTKYDKLTTILLVQTPEITS